MQKPGAGNRADFPDYLLRALLASAQELCGQLSLTESSYLRVALPSHREARGYFLYACVDEVSRVATAMLRWGELTSPSPDGSSASSSDDDDALARMVMSAILTEQSLWLRKLLECFVHVICFGATNEDAYYRHYIYLLELDRGLHHDRELEQFFGQRSANIAFGNKQVAERVRRVESEVDAQRCWYLRKRVKLPDNLKFELSTFNARLKVALPETNSSERLLLGLTYRMYGKASESIHFSIGETHSSTENGDVRRKSLHCGLLAAQILIRGHRLAGVDPQSRATKQMHRVFDSDGLGEQLLSWFTEPVAASGDFVCAMGALAELIETRKSEFGYYMYRVEYLADAPIECIDDEWILPEYVRPLFSREKLISQVRETLKAAGVDPATVSAGKIIEGLRPAAIEMWNAGLRYVAQPEQRDANDRRSS